MKIFAIGDLHLSMDPRIEKPMDIFGSRWQNHAEKVADFWNGLVTDEDVVILPGDISWGLRQEEAMADLTWIHGLPGRKVIIKGNHDLWWTSVSKLNKLFDDITFLQNKCYMAGDAAICGSRGWVCPGSDGFSAHDEKIYKRELIRLELSLKEAEQMGAKHLISALHFPPTNDKLQPSGFTDLMAACGVKTCVYGHLHGKEAFKKGLKGRLDGVEYKLVSLDYLEGKPELIYQSEE